MTSETMETTLPTTSTAAAASLAETARREVATGEGGSPAPADTSAPPSGWAVLIRIFAYLMVLPAAILIAVRYLFDFLG